MTLPADFLFYSDFNCPFCFALSERLLVMGEAGNVHWRGIQHMPAAASHDASLADQTQLINEVSVVRKRAPEINIVTPGFRPNTAPANRLLMNLEAQDPKAQSHLRTLVYRAYWQEGRDISDPDVLAELCEAAGLTFPGLELTEAGETLLARWQQEWEGGRFQRRLPAMISRAQDKPLLGFPTFDLLAGFFAGSALPIAPESLAACELKPRQVVLLVGQGIGERCNTTELEAAYEIVTVADPEAADRWMKGQSCLPDMLVLDALSLGGDAFAYCTLLRQDARHRQTSIILLLQGADSEQELAAFDAGATDVMFDLTHPKVCQARLDLQLRATRSTALLASLARLDHLTELPNRREYDRKLEEEWLRASRTGTSLSVILIDIDHFKAYNDHYGHARGDDCLRQVAKAMARTLRRPADLLARYGGEEFVVLLPETLPRGGRKVAQALAEAVRELQLPHAHASCADHVTVSIGVATGVPKRQGAPRELTEQADAALYRAKKDGRDRIREA
ncbi:diguanylate cyclase domain-containing protein [Motiliproteus sp. SC1-56]|uniref:diguanylate cyclase domain-containing protein n=1 Tax=Motiliproteus sp. SC1-56 TaxID=2799565 RepID=UPI001A9074D2|nr:diguanylate cyclase [Motiliproteus sp. SC1-56]